MGSNTNSNSYIRPIGPEQLRGQETILMADDEPAVRAVIREILREAGYHVLAAAHGAEAVRMLREHAGHVHLALLDVVMPGLDGPATWRQLRALRPDLRVIFVSGYVDGGHRERLPIGAQLLAKPFQIQELLMRVRCVLDDAA